MVGIRTAVVLSRPWFCDSAVLLTFLLCSQHYLHELVIKTLVQHNLFYMLHQFLQYHVLSDSKPLVCVTAFLLLCSLKPSSGNLPAEAR